MKSLLEVLARQGDISGLSYGFARFVAEQSDCEVDSLLAFSAALVSESNQRGDVCIALEQYIDHPLFSTERLPAEALPRGGELQQWQQSLLDSPCVGEPGEETPLILDNRRLYLNRYWNYETRVAEMIAMRLQVSPDVDSSLSQQLEILFPDAHRRGPVDEQKLAVALAASHRFVVISGGPGTGKTSTVIKILAVLLGQRSDMRIKLAAPTGKAAARMMESIRLRIDDHSLEQGIRELMPQQASTIHRLLGYRNQRFHYCGSNQLALDCLVVDEASMIDLTLMYRLLDAIPEQARIILLGDRDQLASVAAGNVLGDITGHGRSIGYSQSQAVQLAALIDTSVQDIPISTQPSAIADSIALLTQSYRFSTDSGIAQLARLINQGAGNEVIEHLQEPDSQLSWYIPDVDRLQPTALDWLLEAYQPVVSSDDVELALAAFEQSRALCAVHSGPCGVEELNRQVEASMRSRHWIDAGDNFRGKPILITTNDYDLELFNGDTGILWPDEHGNLRACFRSADQGIRQLSIFNLPEYVTAWAMTVHKSQGSEFDSVLLVLPLQADSSALSRELLYTGVTRARTHLHLHASSEALLKAIESLTRRHSGLAQKLGW
jgi:exodeoxyribonuclease V alpha subunit